MEVRKEIKSFGVREALLDFRLWARWHAASIYLSILHYFIIPDPSGESTVDDVTIYHWKLLHPLSYLI